MNYLQRKILELVKQGDRDDERMVGGRQCEASLCNHWQLRHLAPSHTAQQIGETIACMLRDEMIFAKGDHHGGTELSANSRYKGAVDSKGYHHGVLNMGLGYKPSMETHVWENRIW